jgi:hypothetical protein
MGQPQNTSDKTPHYTWSYSSISLFQQCPRKYYRLRILKDITEPPQQHLLYGSEVHKAAERYVGYGEPLPAKYSQFQPQLDAMAALPGDRHCELEMGLTKEFEPCAFRDKNVWLRGIADLLVVNGDKARVVDYKTGKSSMYADTKQLELLSLLVFKHFPQVQSVKAGLLFLVSEDLVKAEYAREAQHVAWGKWLPEITRLETALTTNVWNPKPNFTCRKFCAVVDCEHNGRI